MNHQPGFFDIAAEVGLTKHIGGVEATAAPAEWCHTSQASYVLDIGCGVGATPCYLARRYGCQVVGVDIAPRRIELSKERARRERMADRIEFRLADREDSWA